MNIDSITNGFVIDHITAGKGMMIYNILGLDELETIPLCCEKEVSKVEMLDSDGKKIKCDFLTNGKNITIKKSAKALDAVILFIS